MNDPPEGGLEVPLVGDHPEQLLMARLQGERDLSAVTIRDDDHDIPLHADALGELGEEFIEDRASPADDLGALEDRKSVV